MKVQFHTPKGVIEVDSETVTDAELAALGIDRRGLPEAFTLKEEIEALKKRMEKLEKEKEP